jgi:hypothetical protein
MNKVEKKRGEHLTNRYKNKLILTLNAVIKMGINNTNCKDALD